MTRRLQPSIDVAGTPTRGGRMPATLPVLLLVAAWVLLASVWIWTNPLGSAPDESDHYIRAVATGHGEFTGTPAPLAASDPTGIVGGRRYFTIPAGMGFPVQWACDAFHPDQTAACQNTRETRSTGTVGQSAAGTYMPTGYLAPGAFIRLATDPDTALILGRVGGALLSLALLGMAAALVWSRASSLALLWLVLAVTPMQLFLLSEVGPNGLEMAATICFAAALVRLARTGPVLAWQWASLTVAGVVLGTTRPLGPLWVGLAVLGALLLAGFAQVLRRLRERPWAALATTIAVAAAAAGNVWWQSRYPTAGAHVSLRALLNNIPADLNQLTRLFTEMVGVFGWLDTFLPAPLALSWLGAVLLVLALALYAGTWRDRVVIVIVAVAVTFIGAALTGYLTQSFGYTLAGQGVQGRYLMPLAVWIPIVSGEVLLRRRHRLAGALQRSLVPAVLVLTAVIQVGAVYINAQRYAVGAHGAGWFFGVSQWQPPGGWVVWVVVALTGGVALVTAGVAAAGRAAPVGSGPEREAAGAAA